jgi:hypothetical protein
MLRATLRRRRITEHGSGTVGENRMKHRRARFSVSIATAFLAAGILAAASPAQASSGSREMCPVEATSSVDQLLANAYPWHTSHAYTQDIDMRDDTGYNTDYLFAMTKAVASGPITPFFKPLLFVLTVPLDIVTLPFTAIAGFF